MIELILYIFACLKIDLFFTFNLNTMQKFLFVVALTLLYLTNCEVIRAMKNLSVLLFLVLCTLCTKAQVRTEYLFEKGWKFIRSDHTDFSQLDYDDSRWQSVTVPHDWAVYGPFSIQNDRQKVAITQDGQKEAMEHAGRTGGLPFVGVGWYRLDRTLKFLHSIEAKRRLWYLMGL